MSLPYEREEKKISNDELITTGREILLKEAASLEAAAGRLGDEIARAAEGAELVIADPLIRPLVSPPTEFIECPHRALSAHLFEDRAPAQVIESLLGE